jgi:leucyl-tRNA synthetase
MSSKEFIPENITNVELSFWLDRIKNDTKPYTEYGVLINSNQCNGQTSEEAKQKITEFVGGKMKTTYKLRDWVFSRQRYWGEPIPLVHANGKVYPIPESDLPLKLPEVENYEPSDSGESPLADISEWVNVRGFVNDKGEFVVSPDGEIEGRRETNTMPQWAGSCWYYLRYIDPKNSKALVDKNLEQYWQPVDVYVGGMEHATRHLIYARFWHKFLFDIGVVGTEEPFTELHAPGLILAEDGRKMSKRWGNVINPDDMVERFGADAFRLYEAFMGPFDDAIAWNTDGLVGTRRFIERVIRIGENFIEQETESVTRELHKLIKKVGNDIPAFKFNTSVSSMMTFVNLVEKEGGMTQESFKLFVRILAPFAPHITEELWRELGNESSIHLSNWPEYDESKLVEHEVTIAVQINGKIKGSLTVSFDASQEDVWHNIQSNESITKHITGEPKKIIFVPNKLISIVI